MKWLVAGIASLGACTITVDSTDTITPVEPCATSMDDALDGGAEDDLCVMWYTSDGEVVVGPAWMQGG